MTLADQNWISISEPEMVHAFLSAEADREDHQTHWRNQEMEVNSSQPLIREPDFSCQKQNFKRRALLEVIRGGILFSIPRSTTWSWVDFLCDGHLSELYVIAQDFEAQSKRDEIIDSARLEKQNKLIDVAERCPEESKALPDKWKPLILWGHSKKGPFSIIEEIHRLLGYSSSHFTGLLRNRVIIGLSQEWCIWHRPDRRSIMKAFMPGENQHQVCRQS